MHTKSMNKILAVILSVAMLFGIIPEAYGNVNAQGDVVVNDTQQTSEQVTPSPSAEPEYSEEQPVPTPTSAPSAESEWSRSSSALAGSATEPVTVQKYPEYDFDTYEIDPSEAPSKKTLEDLIQEIGLLYANPEVNQRQRAASSDNLSEPAVLDTETIKALMSEGASFEDIIELAYVVRQLSIDPLMLYQLKLEHGGPWAEFLQESLTYNTLISLETDVDPDTDSNKNSVTATEAVYSVTESVYGSGITNVPFTVSSASLIVNLLSVIGDSRMEAINQAAKPQFSDKSASSEQVDPSSGTLIWKSTQMSLPGRDGLDLNIGVLFNSNLANFKDLGYSSGLSKYDLGVGWGFRFPMIEYDREDQIYYHDGEGAIYKVNLSAREGLEGETHLKGYKGKDKRFVQDTNNSFSNGQETSAYYLEYADKKREYFSANNLLGIVDRFGNTITFKYSDKTGRLSEIIDSVNRKVSFEYGSVYYGTLAKDQESSPENITVIAKDPSGVESQRVTYTRKRVGHGLQSVYETGAVTHIWVGTPEPVLTTITDQLGKQTQFTYTKNMHFSNSQAKEFRPWDNYVDCFGYIQLDEVKYAHSLTKYEYGFAYRNMGFGAIGTHFVSSRYDQLLKSGSFSGKYNAINYSQIGSYDAFPEQYDEGQYPASFTYSTVTTELLPEGNRNTQYTFNGNGQLLSSDVAAPNGERTVQRNTAFHSVFTQSPTASEYWVYGSGDDDSSASKLYSDFSYDDWGNIASETKPLTLAQRSDGNVKAKYTTSYTYEPTHHLITSKSWYPNESSGAVSESYSYTAQGRLSSTVNALKETTDYTYENAPDGTSKVYRATAKISSDGKVLAKSVTTYGAETGYAYPTETKSYSNLSTSEQAVSMTMTYDMGSGRLLSESDGNHQTTSYSYDALGRLLKVTKPQFTNDNNAKFSETEEYIYKNNQASIYFDAANAGISCLSVDTIHTVTNTSTNETVQTKGITFYNGLGAALLQERYDPNLVKFTQTQYHYDEWNRPVYQIDNEGNTQTVSYDGWGNVNSSTDAFGNRAVAVTNLKQRTTISYLVAAGSGEQFNYAEENYDY